MIKQYNSLAYSSLDDFIYASSPNPVTLKNGMVIGGGTLYPEVNFTLPPMSIDSSTMPEVIAQYKEIITGICRRAVELFTPGFIAEIELLPPLTFNPEWGIEVCKTVRDIMYEYETKYGLKSALRITPVDIREGNDLLHMYRGSHWERILQTFEGCARAGADLLAIESVGGKETHDEAVMYCDTAKSLFALSVVGGRDMHRLWTEIVRIADETGTIAAGDTACGFANTAMVLADRNYVPKVFAAIVRVIAAARNLCAVEVGARGPHKDCGYENVYVKAITGTPIAMEGRTAAVAHLSPVGNIAGCVADLWSNESVQNIKLLGGMAPTISFEQLVYDCRLMNGATQRGSHTARLMRDLLADSDSALDPQAYVLRPDVVFEIAGEMIKESTCLGRAKRGAQHALQKIRSVIDASELAVDVKEKAWLDTIESQLEEVPDDEEAFIDEMLPLCEKLDPAKYDLR